MNPARNIELKARLHDLTTAREIAKRLATEYLGFQQQTDTYFHCPLGRMKLREIIAWPPGARPAESSPVGREAQLIWYERPDQAESKESNYQLVEITDPDRVRQLKTEMGIWRIVSKRREIFLHHNVRIHLDEVDRLGTFIEFEAVLREGIEDATGKAQVAELEKEFGIAAADLLATSYADLLLPAESAR